MYVYIKTQETLWAVGFYDPAGRFIQESSYPTTVEAAERVHYLNGRQNDKEVVDF